MKNQKGVNLVSLSVAVIVIITIVGTVLYNVRTNLGVQKLKAMQADIENLRGKVANYYLQYGALPILKQQEIEDSILSENVKTIENGNIETVKYYVIDLSAMENITLTYGEDYENLKDKSPETIQTLSNGTLTDVYIINSVSHNIFYVHGITYEGKTYYTQYQEEGKEKIGSVDIDLSDLLVIAKAISEGTVYNDNTPMTDEYGNTFIIPKGFKLSKDSAEVVTEGIVIEDATYTNTKGSEFVWIPVSKDNKKIVGPAYSGTDKIAKKEATINLSRYKFGVNGPIDKGANTIDNYYTESASSLYGEAVAKTDVTAANGFKEKTKAAGGFWIGRYEARIEGYESLNTDCPWDDPNWIGYTGGKLVEKPGAQVFNYITQNKASELSQKMYEKENDGTTSITKFESDLINSYAWDTATLFLQEFGWENYSRQTSINTSGPNANGTVSDSNKDNPCNIYDMASNCAEWTTETYRDYYVPCVIRGGSYRYGNDYVSTRNYNDTTYAYDYYSFRPVLYIK